MFEEGGKSVCGYDSGLHDSKAENVPQTPPTGHTHGNSYGT